MKKLLCHLSLAALLLMAFGCGSDNSKKTPSTPDNPPTPGTSLKVTAGGDQTLFSNDTEAKTVKFTSPSAWTAEVEDAAVASASSIKAASAATTWISIDPKSGSAGDKSITVSLQANTSGADRTVYIVISAGSSTVKVTITQVAVEGGKTAAEYIILGNNTLKNEKYDEAVNYYESAYIADNDNTKAIIYSAMGKIAKISTDPKVVDLLKNKFGFSEYPNRLNALFSDDWMKEYPKYVENYYDEALLKWLTWHDEDDVNSTGPYYSDIKKVGYYYYTYETLASSAPLVDANDRFIDSYYDSSIGKSVYWYNADPDNENRGAGYYFYKDYPTHTFVSETPRYEEVDFSLPSLIAPEWLKGGSDSWYNRSLLGNSTTKVESFNTWILLLVANILDRNPEGMNDAIDDSIDSIFGDSFNEALNRIKKLEAQKSTTISLDKEFIDGLSLDEFIDVNDKVGWAELNGISSMMIAMKASLEWVASYDLNGDFNFLKYSWKEDSDDFYKDATDHLKSLDVKDLPFNNHFMDPRPGKMAVAKADFIIAIQGVNVPSAKSRWLDVTAKAGGCG